MTEAMALALPMGAMALGVLFGATIQRSHFCTMGCISDAVLFGSFRRLRIWALAIAVALAGSQLLQALGLVDLAATAYRQPDLFWLGAIVGGIMFGFGMVLAGGCASRNLARLGGGSLKALVTLLVMGVVAYATTFGVLAPLYRALRAIGVADLGRAGVGDQGLPALLAGLTDVPSGWWAILITLAVAITLLLFCFRDVAFRRARGDIVTGLVLGALVPAGWLLTGWLFAAPSAPAPAQSITFVGPVGGAVHYVMTGGAGLDFGVALVIGTVAGALAVALQRRQFRFEGFVSRDDMVRHLLGGALMGCGGSLALGCTIGQGLTGVSTLSIGSWLALASIMAGGWWGVKFLETGRLLPRFRRRQPATVTAGGIRTG
ncbi:MAG: YeeE/YedE family protein [Geminicoccaceae bacterium]